MENDREISREILASASSMRGALVARERLLSDHEEKVARAMRSAVESTRWPPRTSSLADVIDSAGRRIVSEVAEACNSAGLDKLQSEALLDVTRRGIEAFIKACGIAMLAEIRAGCLEPERDALLCRVDQVLPRVLRVEDAGQSVPLRGAETPGATDLV